MFPPNNILTTTKFAKWIKDNTSNGAKFVVGRLPAVPNRVVGIVPVTGPGMQLEGIQDVISYTVSCRGGENNFDDSEGMALEIDRLLIEDRATFQIGNTYIYELGRAGSGPVVGYLPDSESRWTFTCTYYARISTNVGQVN